MIEKNERLAFLCDRLQKITEALYRVTDLLPEKEPLKWEMREKAIAVFSKVISLPADNPAGKNLLLSELENLLNQLIILLSLFSANKTVATINFDILKEEYGAAKKIISEEKNKPIDFIKLGKALLASPASLRSGPAGGPPPLKGQNSIGQAIGQSNGQKEVAKNTAKNDKNDNRKEKIINILKDKKEATISELLPFFPECGEKTLQRELLAMAARGLIVKKGDKRWRKYGLL